MQKLAYFASAALSFAALQGCADTSSTDELAGEAEEGIDSKADTDGGVYTYFTLTADLRKCAAPVCGGFFLNRLNASTTKCVDGSYQTDCYTPELDLSEAGLPASAFDKLVSAANVVNNTHAIVRGRFAKTNSTPQPSLGRFVVTEVWLAQSDAVPSGVFAKVLDNGIRCITAPCPSTTEKALNSSRKANIADIDFTDAQVSEHVLETVAADMFKPYGAIIAGDRYKVSPHAKGRTATAVFLRLTADAPEACFVGGCSAQICSDQEGVISTCEFRPEYACYADATCERQGDGTCGWTQTEELTTCIADAGGN